MLGIILTATTCMMASLPPARFEVELKRKGRQPVAASLELTAGADYRHGYVRVLDGADTIAQIHVDSHETIEGRWHEVTLANGSVDTANGFWEGDYTIRLIEPSGESWSVNRKGCLLFDGCGYTEFFGQPHFNPQPGLEWYFRYLLQLLAAQDLSKYLQAARAAPVPATAESYPHTMWDAEDWHSHDPMFDPAFSTHLTGSPHLKGYIGSEAARYLALRAFGTQPGDKAKYEQIAGWLMFKHGQQCRRPIHFWHDDGDVWTANDWPKLTMGEWGPTTTWNATEFWCRDKFSQKQLQQGKWNGWDLEHVEVHTQAQAYLLFGSRGALRDMRHKLEAVLTRKVLKDEWYESTPRTWGWSLQALCIGAAIDPDPARAARYRAGADFLMAAFDNHFITQPRLSFMSSKTISNGAHLWATPEELQEYFVLQGWKWIDQDPFYLADLADIAALEQKLDDLPSSATEDEVRAAMNAVQEAWSAFYVKPYGAWHKKHAEVLAAEKAYENSGDPQLESVWTEARKKESVAVASYVDHTHGSQYYWSMLGIWAWVSCFQMGAVASGIRTYADLIGDYEAVRPQAEMTRDYLLLEARNFGEGGTFWYDTAVWLPGITVGNGMLIHGVVHWTAGGLSMLEPWISAPMKPVWIAAVDSVYRASYYAEPVDELSSFDAWFAPYAVKYGYP